MSLTSLRAAVPCALLLALLAAAPALAQQVPLVPAPVAVTLDPAHTAVLVLDITTQTCSSQPNCLEFVPRVANLLADARANNVFVLYTTQRHQIEHPWDGA